MKRMIWITVIVVVVIVVVVAVLALFTDVFYSNGTVPEAEGGPHTVAPHTVAPQPPAVPSEEPDDPGDGYREDRSDPDAPKTIESELIIAFDCRFSTMDLAEEDATLGNHIYQLQARLVDGAVRGTYQIRDTGEEKLFRADHSFLNAVRDLVKKYGIARLNGHCVEVMGLPGDYGVDLQIVYGSGEHLDVYDNEDCVLPYEFLEELHALFVRELPKT